MILRMSNAASGYTREQIRELLHALIERESSLKAFCDGVPIPSHAHDEATAALRVVTGLVNHFVEALHDAR